jgi:DNA cross-link repair 1C protein
MSTFDGIVREFPRIRIDFFRTNPSQPPPLACFLSHIHSDHLQGLESLKSPFVYCSSATRQLLLQIEKYPHRMNFMKGVLESRKQHYKHLKLVLKAVPLECPTEIELGPLENIRVTLFDSNHCPGAVMFLIEGDNKAVLYTGDVRSEPWWVNSLVRNPVLLPYTTALRQLDRIYLDTTFAVNEDIYRTFPYKADGIHELLEKTQQYPPETLFHLNTWTLGYEEVWVALSAFLKSRVSKCSSFWSSLPR